MIKFEFVLWAVDIDDLLDDVIDDGVDVAFALQVLLWWNGLCDDNEACF